MTDTVATIHHAAHNTVLSIKSSPDMVRNFMVRNFGANEIIGPEFIVRTPPSSLSHPTCHSRSQIWSGILVGPESWPGILEFRAMHDLDFILHVRYSNFDRDCKRTEDTFSKWKFTNCVITSLLWIVFLTKVQSEYLQKSARAVDQSSRQGW